MQRYKGRFAGDLGIKNRDAPVSVKLPPDLYDAVKNLPKGEKADLLRKWIREGLARDGYITE